MVGEMREGQRLFPFLYVDDVRAYVRFLVEAFGFVEYLYEEEPGDPEHVHAEVKLGEAVLMIGHATSRWGTAAPRSLPALANGVYAYVDDADAHCRRARAAGATIETEPEDRPWGHRMYTARDPEGHQWYFATPQRRAR